MKRLAWIGIALGLTCAASAQVRMFVTMGGKRIGQAVASQKLLPDGAKLVQLSMQITGPNGETVNLRSSSQYDPKGQPTRMFHESITGKAKVRRAVTVTFSKSGANVVEDVSGTRKTKQVPLVASAPWASASEFWFIRDTPKPGQADKRYRFNISSLDWELTTTTYVGRKMIDLNGKKVTAHELKSNQGTAHVDGGGMPIRIDLGQIKLEKAPDA